MAQLWAEVLPDHSSDMFGPQSNFFEEGGHSIRAQQLLFRVRREWKDADVPMSAVFHSPTLEAFAAEIERAQDPLGLRLDAAPLLAGNSSGSIHDDTYAADAQELASRLPQSIPRAEQRLDIGSCTVFLTGVTGFLGSYVLRELLVRNPELHVLLHVRCEDSAAGLARVETATKAYGLWCEDWQTRLTVLPGDIAKPQLGLSPQDWKLVTQTAHVIVHNGAQVNWMLPYARLRAANVLSTVECVALCADHSGLPKRLIFVSSTSTLDHAHFVAQSERGVPVSEDDDLGASSHGLSTGYGQSKWASEFIVRSARRRGLCCTVVRPGYITGHPRDGICVTDDFLVRLWKGCIQVSARPAMANTVNMVPVSRVSKLIVGAALLHPYPLGARDAAPSADALLPVVHVTSHPRRAMDAWLGALEAYGYSVPQVDYAAWRARLHAYVASSSESESAQEAENKSTEGFALLPLFHYVVGNLPAESVAPELDDTNATALLRALHAQIPASNISVMKKAADESGTQDEDAGVSLDTAGVYLAFLVAVGFLPPPPPPERNSASSKVDGAQACLAHKGSRLLPECSISPERLAALASLGMGGRSGAGAGAGAAAAKS